MAIKIIRGQSQRHWRPVAPQQFLERRHPWYADQHVPVGNKIKNLSYAKDRQFR